MRLLIDARSFVGSPPGGVGKVALQLTKAYAETFPHDHILCTTTGLKKSVLPIELQSLSNIEHIHITVPNKLWSTACVAGITSLDRRVEAQVGQCDAAFFPNIGFFGRPRIRHAILLHDLSFLIEPRWFTYKQRAWHRVIQPKKIVHHAQNIFSVSQRTARDAERCIFFPAKDITVLPIGQTLFAKKTSNQLQKFPTFFALVLGHGDTRKNSRTAIEAVRQLRATTHQQLEIVLIGRSHANYPDPWIHILTEPSDAHMIQLFTAAAVFLYPSWYEGYGLPLHEAASVRTPCIASTTGALPETAPHGTLFADPAKPHHWARAIQVALHTSRKSISPDPLAWQKAAHLLREKLR